MGFITGSTERQEKRESSMGEREIFFYGNLWTTMKQFRTDSGSKILNNEITPS